MQHTVLLEIDISKHATLRPLFLPSVLMDIYGRKTSFIKAMSNKSVLRLDTKT